MIGAVHASIGAGVGSFFKSKSSAFAAGIVSHIIADAIPHKDFDPKIEVPLMFGALAAIAKWRGVDSPEFLGAIGGIIPDSEHALVISGVIEPEQRMFPTHINDGKFHGKETGERWSQLLIAAASLLTVALKTSDEPE